MFSKVELKMIVGIMAMGSIWGMLEATLGGVLHLVYFPYTGAVMSSLGFFLMGWALASYKKTWIPFSMAVVASSFKLLDVVILALSPFARMIVNPAMAIILEGLVLVGVIGITNRVYQKNFLCQAGTGFIGMYLSYLAFSCFFFYVLHQGPLEVVSIGELALFALKDGGIASMMAIFSFPLGLWIGAISESKLSFLFDERKKLYYASSVIVISLCWVVSALTIFAK